MDYGQHYDNLITRAKNRTLDKTEYIETRHIIPRGIDGNDMPINLVEHLIAR